MYLFFSGKGGVGKTSLACATAVSFADNGLKTLIVTTDPASNLGDVFEQDIGPRPVPILSVANLDAQEIDAEDAARLYRERALQPLKGLVPEDMLAAMEEQMSGPCSVEIAGFDEFVGSMFRSEYDVVVFDTAPTGHTLRLLELPSAWSTHIEESAQGSGQTCIGPVDQLKTSKDQYDRAVALLKDDLTTHFVFVAQPERTSVSETLRASNELKRLGMDNQRLVVNGLIPEEAAGHPFFASRRAMQKAAVHEIAASFSKVVEVPLLDGEVKGIDRLRMLGRWVDLDAYAMP